MKLLLIPMSDSVFIALCLVGVILILASMLVKIKDKNDEI